MLHKLSFSRVIGNAADFETVPNAAGGYDCLINGQTVPGVLTQKLILGESVPTVVLEIAVRSYKSHQVKATLE